jgi:hypothetical protein
MSGEMVKFDNEQQLKDHLESCRDEYSLRGATCSWSGPGEYWIYTKHEPCPRGCCTDGYVLSITKEELKLKLQEKMKPYKDLLEKLASKENKVIYRYDTQEEDGVYKTFRTVHFCCKNCMEMYIYQESHCTINDFSPENLSEYLERIPTPIKVQQVDEYGCYCENCFENIN